MEMDKFISATLPRRGCSRVARYYLFKPNIPIWENFEGP
jgi:hypothetical protein